LGDLEIKKEQIRNIVKAHKVCATKKNNAIATKIYFRNGMSEKKIKSNLRGFTLHLELLIPVADDVTFVVGMDREVILTGVLSSIRS